MSKSSSRILLGFARHASSRAGVKKDTHAVHKKRGGHSCSESATACARARVSRSPVSHGHVCSFFSKQTKFKIKRVLFSVFTPLWFTQNEKSE